MGAAKNRKKGFAPLPKNILGWNVSALSPSHTTSTDDLTFLSRILFVYTGIHELSCHHLSPFLNTTLKRPQLAVSKAPRVLTL
jgi:hypothetical protein